MLLLLMLLLLGDGQAPRPRPAAPAPRPAPRPATPAPAPPSTSAPRPFYTSTLPPGELHNKQAVLETTQGTIVLDLLGETAPNHVAHFITRAREGAYDGTTFHRVVAMGMIQGGDPWSKDPAQTARYGTGGLGELRFEASAEKLTRGAVAAVLIPGERDSAGSQFFILITDQAALEGQYTVFARVAEGINTAQKISTLPAADSVPAERVVIKTVTIRDTPAAAPEPFSTDSVEALGQDRAVIETSLGNIVIEFLPDRAPNHVRQFLRLAQTGVYDHTAFHRIARGFVVQGGYLQTRSEPLDERQQASVRPLAPEFNDTIHDRGIVSMARGDDPGSATSSFFIVLARTPALDHQYTAFGRVVSGMEVVAKMEAAPVDGETPQTRIEVTRVTVMRP